jgi:hypothetical protein
MQQFKVNVTALSMGHGESCDPAPTYFMFGHGNLKSWKSKAKYPTYRTNLATYMLIHNRQMLW